MDEMVTDFTINLDLFSIICGDAYSNFNVAGVQAQHATCLSLVVFKRKIGAMISALYILKHI